jgi:hypothetical protein
MNITYQSLYPWDITWLLTNDLLSSQEPIVYVLQYNFYIEKVVNLSPSSILLGYLLLAVHHCLFNIFAATSIFRICSHGTGGMLRKVQILFVVSVVMCCSMWWITFQKVL